MTHIMLDLETWGKTPGSDIRSIGAVVFDPIAGTVGRSFADCLDGTTSFYIATDNRPVAHFPGGEPAIWQYELTRDPETVQWWSEQTPETQAAFANPVDLREALEAFVNWYSYHYAEDAVTGEPRVRLWANGPQFDVSILDAVYRAVQLPTPWHYRAPRDFRTITDAAGMTRDDFQQFSHGTAHNALDDAISQAKIVCEAYRRLGLQR